MPHAERSIVIDRPPDEVFAFFSDPANDRRWRAGVNVMEPQGAVGVGRRVHQVVAGPGGRGITADIEVTAYEPPSRYAFKTVAGPARPVGEFRFEPAAAGTEVRFTLDAQLGGLKGLFMNGAVQRSMDGEMAALDRAKAILEGR